jgi:hypothetical protein
VDELEEPPLAAGFTTVTLATPIAATSAVVMAACNSVLEMKDVGRVLPSHWTADVETKFVPVIVRVNPAPPAMAELGFNNAIVGGGTLIVNVSALEAPPPGAGVETVTIAVPTVAISGAVIAACKLVLETKVVVRALPFH